MCDEDVAALVVDNGSGKFTKYIYLPYPFLVTDRLFSLTFPIALLFLLTFPTYVLLYLSNLRIYCFVLLDLSILFICSHLTDLSNISLYILCSHWPFQYILYILCFHWPFKSIYLHIMFSLTFPIYLSPYYVLTDLSNIFLYYSVHCTVCSPWPFQSISLLCFHWPFQSVCWPFQYISLSLFADAQFGHRKVFPTSAFQFTAHAISDFPLSLYLSICLSLSLSLCSFPSALCCHICCGTIS